jgi:hypothetical protein
MRDDKIKKRARYIRREMEQGLGLVPPRVQPTASRPTLPYPEEAQDVVVRKGFYQEFKFDDEVDYYARDVYRTQNVGEIILFTTYNVYQELVPTGKLLDITSVVPRVMVRDPSSQFLFMQDAWFCSWGHFIIQANGKDLLDQRSIHPLTGAWVKEMMLNRNLAPPGIPYHLYIPENNTLTVGYQFTGIPVATPTIIYIGFELRGAWFGANQFSAMKERQR